MNAVVRLGVVALLCSLVDMVSAAERPKELVLNKGDHICIVGNTLAERMQHHGWLETLHPRPLPAARAGRSATWAIAATRSTAGRTPSTGCAR